MKNSIVIFILVFLLINFSCRKKEEPAIAKYPEQTILGEWEFSDLFYIGGKKMIFRNNGFCEIYFKDKGEPNWRLIQDSIAYSVNQSCISIDDEEAFSNPHKLTQLNKNGLRYEVVGRNGAANPRQYIRK